MNHNDMNPLGVEKGFINGEALRLLRANSSEKEFKTRISHFRPKPIDRGYPEAVIMTALSKIEFKDRKPRLALQQKCKDNERILYFIAQYHPTSKTN